MPDGDTLERFLEKWGPSAGSERGNYAGFLYELCDELGVPRPDAQRGVATQDAYVIDKPVTFTHPDGKTSPGFIDLYKRGCFVCETKQGVEAKRAKTAAEALAADESPDADKKPARRGHGVRGTKAWDDAMIAARAQAEGYVRALPDDNPPFVVVMDVGYTIELYADFSRLGKVYTPFPDAQSHRIKLDQLREEPIRARLALLWTDPLALDPARQRAKVTREIADKLAQLSKSLEKQGHDPEHAAQFLMRCLFTLFAEDVGLLPKGSFTARLKALESDPDRFPLDVRAIWQAMDAGDYSPALEKKLLRFNGGLFKDTDAFSLNSSQIRILHEAATKGWEDVEPSIFGTLLERALEPGERHKLGAHYTPRAYVERLVLPTLIEPLREDLAATRTAALTVANRPIDESLTNARQDEQRQRNRKLAQDEIHRFLDRLCNTIVLDPACGTGNFLYVAMAKMKDLEGEARDLLVQLGQDVQSLYNDKTVDPHQFLGIEINPRAAAIAELVLWIGYLQWHFRTYGNTPPREPVLRAFHNIENRDAVLAYDAKELVVDAHAKPVTRWDGRTTKPHPVTGEPVPDESARVPVYRYVNPRKAEWPKADYVVGNPPFIGNKRMRELLDDGYVEALRTVRGSVPGSADLVMYWWGEALELLENKRLRRAGLITTNSITQSFNRKVFEDGLKTNSIAYAIPDHPWVDGNDGAAVRVAMTVCTTGKRTGELLKVESEYDGPDGAFEVKFTEQFAVLHADLTAGVRLADAVELKANIGICIQGVVPIGLGFVLDQATAISLGRDSVEGLTPHIRRYRNGRDLSQISRDAWIIDLEGLTEIDVRKRFPSVYQHVLDTVKPERDHNRELYRRENWWKFGRKHTDLRSGLDGLSRYIATVKTAKHRVFLFVDGDILPDSKLYAVASDDAFSLGVLSSKLHVRWATAVGGWLGVGNDPTYNNRDCFNKFPFPTADDAQRVRIRELGEQLDAHRKRQQAVHPTLTVTDLYNVLEKLRSGEPLNDKDRRVHEQGLASVLRQIHDDLDRAVFDAYGWPATLTDEQILERLVALNAERAAEERRGLIRWLRPEFQQPRAGGSPVADDPDADDATPARPARRKSIGQPLGIPGSGTIATVASRRQAKRPWPKTMAEQAHAVRTVLGTGDGTAAEITKRFSRAKVDAVTEILDTLTTLGQARRDAEVYRAN